ncbi:PP-loop domain-containing protein, partial [Methanocaldococcus villosus KIN24-T80]
MLCSCGKVAVYYQRYANKYLCEECFKKSVEKRVKKTIKDVIRNNVKIAIAISGGKDSLVMAKLLKNLFKNIPNCKLTCFFVNEGIRGFRDKAIKYVKEFCKREELDLKIISFKEEIGYNLDEILEHKDKLNIGKPCSFCGVLRRYILNKYALGYDYLAIGHNLDDMAQTILMNYVEGNIKNIVHFGKDIEDKKFVKRIRPLKYIPEEEVKLYADIEGIVYQSEPCPYSSLSYRHRMKEVIKTLENIDPKVKFSIVKGYERLLNYICYKEEIKRCKICGFPSNNEICKV